MTDFEKVYVEYFPDVYKYVLSLCHDQTMAEDITQETFLKAIKNIHHFKGECKLRVWLCHIAKNTYFTAYKKKKDFLQLSDEISMESFESKLLNKEKAFEIHKALHSMEEPYKEVFNLRLFGELSFTQIGELFGKSESWARVTFHRAKLKLKEELK